MKKGIFIAAAIATLVGLVSTACAKAERYCLREYVVGEPGKIPLGYSNAHLNIAHSSSRISIALEYDRPDNGQVHGFEVAGRRDGNRHYAFTYDDDGWGDHGNGEVELEGQTAKVWLHYPGREAVRAMTSAERPYPSFVLTTATCLKYPKFFTRD